MKLLLIHHSHTDIGYTERQEITIKNQVNNIHNILRYIDDIERGKSEYKNFKWVCETFIIVEKFFNVANEEDKRKFIKYVKKGYIGLSAGYANMAELVSPNIMENVIARSQEFAAKYDVTVNCGMQADVNGFGLGYAEALSNNGIENYLAFVHTHHGMYPMNEKHTAFKWELPNKKQITIWSGEHYMFGNAFGFSPGAISQYGFDDELDFEKYNKQDSDSWMEIAHSRLVKYIKQVKNDGWNNEFILQGIHGKFTDNSPVNIGIFKRINEWNEKYGDFVEVVAVTLEEAFDEINKIDDLPVVTGDWPDWWTDGIGSAPRETKIYKNTQTRFEKTLLLDYKNEITQNEIREIENDIVLYSEHTFGSWDSISNPYHAFSHEQWAAKQWYCFNALRKVDDIEHKILLSHGDATNSSYAPKHFKIINVSNSPIYRILQLPFSGADALSLSKNLEIIDNNNKLYKYFLKNDIPIIYVKVEANSELIITINDDEKSYESKNNMIPKYSRFQAGGSDGVDDLSRMLDNFENCDCLVTTSKVETKYLKIEWSEEGIIKWFDKVNKIDVIKNINPFSPIYEVTKVTPRNKLGRNRKGPDVKRDYGKINNILVVENNIHQVIVELHYTVEGTNLYIVTYNIDKYSSRVDVSIKLEKTIESCPENLYFTLPFLSNDDEVYFGKHYSYTQPWKNQIPGTLIDYYSVFEGIVVEKNNIKLLITTPDTQLVQAGELKFGDRLLFGDKELKEKEINLNIWAMNNIWETNFVKNLAGFYEFNFVVEIHNKDKKISECMDICKAYNMGVLCIPYENKEKV